MIDLWTDIYIANAATTVKNTKLQRKINYMPFVYQKYNVDSARFMESNIYYTSKAADYEKMFQEVEKRLKNLKSKYDPEYADIDPDLPIWKKDSIIRSRQLKQRKNPKELNIEVEKKNPEILETVK